MEKALKSPIYFVLIVLLVGLGFQTEAASGLAAHSTKTVTTQQKKKLSFKERVALKILKKRIKKAQKKAAKKQLKPTKESKSNGLFRGLGKILLGGLGVVLGALLLVGGVFTLNVLTLLGGVALILLGVFGIVKGAFNILW